jgi:hypothetical protein
MGSEKVRICLGDHLLTLRYICPLCCVPIPNPSMRNRVPQSLFRSVGLSVGPHRPEWSNRRGSVRQSLFLARDPGKVTRPGRRAVSLRFILDAQLYA